MNDKILKKGTPMIKKALGVMLNIFFVFNGNIQAFCFYNDSNVKEIVVTAYLNEDTFKSIAKLEGWTTQLVLPAGELSNLTKGLAGIVGQENAQKMEQQIYGTTSTQPHAVEQNLPDHTGIAEQLNTKFKASLKNAAASSNGTMQSQCWNWKDVKNQLGTNIEQLYFAVNEKNTDPEKIKGKLLWRGSLSIRAGLFFRGPDAQGKYRVDQE